MAVGSVTSLRSLYNYFYSHMIKSFDQVKRVKHIRFDYMSRNPIDLVWFESIWHCLELIVHYIVTNH